MAGNAAGKTPENFIEGLRTLLLGRTRLARQEALWAYIFMLPWLAGFLLLRIGPFVVSAVMSVFEWRGYGPATFVGLYNYEWIFTNDRLFRQALQVTSSYAVLAVPIGLVLAFLIAWMLSTNVPGVEFFRAIYYMPSVVTGVAVAFVWIYIFDPRNGPLNILIQTVLGLDEPIPWLSSPRWVLPSFVLMSTWGIGGSMIILLAGLKGIPTTLYEAATIDGAGRWHKLRHVTLPLLSPSLFYVLILLTVDAFQVVTVPLVIFGPNTDGTTGPMNSALFYALYLYRMGFSEARMGYASALAWILFVIILLFTLLNFVLVGRRVYYER